MRLTKRLRQANPLLPQRSSGLSSQAQVVLAKITDSTQAIPSSPTVEPTSVIGQSMLHKDHTPRWSVRPPLRLVLIGASATVVLGLTLGVLSSLTANQPKPNGPQSNGSAASGINRPAGLVDCAGAAKASEEGQTPGCLPASIELQTTETGSPQAQLLIRLAGYSQSGVAELKLLTANLPADWQPPTEQTELGLWRQDHDRYQLLPASAYPVPVELKLLTATSWQLAVGVSSFADPSQWVIADGCTQFTSMISADATLSMPPEQSDCQTKQSAESAVWLANSNSTSADSHGVWLSPSETPNISNEPGAQLNDLNKPSLHLSIGNSPAQFLTVSLNQDQTEALIGYAAQTQ
jgi:hypothetical protein